jgi:membrane protein
MPKAQLDLKLFGKRLWRELVKDHVSNGAAALAFYLLLALFPGAIFGITVLRYVPVPRLQLAATDLVGQTLPMSAAQIVTKSVESVESGAGPVTLVFGLVFALWSASSGLAGIIQQLNIIYDVEEERSFLRIRLLAVVLALAFCGLILGSLALAVFGGMLQSYIGNRMGWSPTLLTIFASLRWVVIALALQVAFSLVYYLGPNVKRSFAFFTPGSLVATAGLLLASIALKLYVSLYASFDALYGGLGAVIVLLIWLFLAGWVTLLGGEINNTLRQMPHMPRQDSNA